MMPETETNVEDDDKFVFTFEVRQVYKQHYCLMCFCSIFIFGQV